MSAQFAPALRLCGLTKHFDTIAAVKGLDLDVEYGEFLTLLGPSGCGKTTTLMLIAGFEQPSAGRIVLGGVDITDTAPFTRRVNTVFQHYALFPHMTVFDNVAFGLRMAGLSRTEVRRRVREQLELVSLTGYEKRYPRQLSGGQQQRVALARALVNEPQVLLLDEPLGALDLTLRRHMQLELKLLQERLGMTFIYVTHDQEEALTMSDRIAVMNEGRLEQVGSPQDIYEKPRTRFVARFVGETNLLPAHCDRGQAAESGLISVRPERIRLAQEGESAIAGRVTDTVYAGATVKVFVSVPGWDEPLLITAAPGTPVSRLRLHDEVHLTWDRTDAVRIASGQ